MPLYERLIGEVEPKIRVHAFMAALGEWERGKVTRQQIIAAFALDAGEQTELDTLTAKFLPPPESISLGAFVILTNVGTTYDASAASKGLGLVQIQGAGCTHIDFLVVYNKVGTGTLSWQLWDDTSGTEVCRVDDAVVADNKSGTAARDFSPPLSAGMHTLRVRCKSTVAADDPVYYGSSVRVRRVDMLVAEVLHQLLLLGEARTPPYDSAAAVRARLGV